MSELRFNCPSCGQHLSGDTSYSGQRVTCPSCQAQVVVPPGMPLGAGVPGAPPFPGARPPFSASAPQKTSGLAIASLVCSVGSFLIIPLGFVPGIICGHLAKKDMERTPALQGRGLATAGLIVGYVSLSLHVLVVFAVLGFIVHFAPQASRSARGIRPHRSVHTTPTQSTPQQAETTDTEPDGSGWTLQLKGVDTPAAAVTGRIHGQSFKLDKVILDHGWLKFSQGSGFFPDLGLELVLFESDSAALSGRTFTVPREGFGTTPHVYLKWMESGSRVPNQSSFVERYALRLEFGQLSGNKLPGKIYICLPDQEKSFLAGTFEAEIKSRP